MCSLANHYGAFNQAVKFYNKCGVISFQWAATLSSSAWKLDYKNDSQVFHLPRRAPPLSSPPQPRSTSPTLWRASASRSGSLPFKSTDARQPLYPSRDAINLGRLLYMLFPTPPMYSSPVRCRSRSREIHSSKIKQKVHVGVCSIAWVQHWIV